MLQYYDDDKSIPAYGFGATVNETGAWHKFALNGDYFRPECDGIAGVEIAYKHCLNNTRLYGPTNFSEFIEALNERSEQCEVSQYNQEYNVLLILTDGAISDMPKTIDAIVRASSQPISIIIVGVGSADFKSMETLDADMKPLYSPTYRKHMERDIVQFVPFNDCKNDQFLLAKEVLGELPNQLVDYFVTRGILPNKPKFEEREALKRQLSMGSKVSLG